MRHTVGIAYGFLRGQWIGHSTGHLFELLKGSFAGIDCDVQKLGLLDLRVEIRDNELKVYNLAAGEDASELSGVYFANWRKQPEFALALAELMKREKKPVLSEEVFQVMPMTKLGELVLLSGKDIAIPDSVFMRNKHWKRLLKSGDMLPFEFPFIMKVINGSMGIDNFLVTSRQQLKEIVSKDKDVLFVAQEFIPNTHDYRIIIMGGAPQLVIRRSRTNSDTHLNNTSQGAAGELVSLTEINPEILELSVRAANATRRPSFSGVDVIQNSDTGKYYVLEVNKTPQMETGTNTEQKVAALTGYFRKALQ